MECQASASEADVDLRRLVDAHAHPHDTPDFRSEFDAVSRVSCSKVCVMSSHLKNQRMTSELFEAFPGKVIPAYGLHPWWCHHLSTTIRSKYDHYATLFSDIDGKQSLSSPNDPHPSLTPEFMDCLPEPVPLSDAIEDLKQKLLCTPSALVGEIGLDRAFRLPNLAELNELENSNKGKETPVKKLTRLKTPVSHQLSIFTAQLDVAIELGRPVSVHCVQAQGPILETLTKCRREYGDEKWLNCHICLHSFLGSAQIFTEIQRLHPNVFFSFSTILGARSPRTEALIQATSTDRILVETDWNSAKAIDDHLRSVTCEIAKAKGWSVAETAEQLEKNWSRFYRSNDKV